MKNMYLLVGLAFSLSCFADGVTSSDPNTHLPGGGVSGTHPGSPGGDPGGARPDPVPPSNHEPPLGAPGNPRGGGDPGGTRPDPPPPAHQCTQEAKVCSDGVTTVTRQGPHCEFAACPGETSPPGHTLPNPGACSQEAKVCSDGVTTVTRQGPHCKFALCPDQKAKRKKLRKRCKKLADRMKNNPNISRFGGKLLERCKKRFPKLFEDKPGVVPQSGGNSAH